MTGPSEATGPSDAALRAAAGAVPDPELPVVTLADLGVLRALRRLPDGGVEVDLTPTYTGCPAVETMAADLRAALLAAGARRVAVRTVLTPPWSTDDITPEGRRKLAAANIAPPRPTGTVLIPLSCPNCGSEHTTLLSRFSATACLALRRCAACAEPFDHVKER
ncbi:phenylacetate-CoA oxygenase subunit PaaJ [Streptomyces sp. 8K308]|uniref:1,2-phenylacetyl-CoA epoxidase subunit PaaD n=1 Tax=Streptomyces sp. 8K308 TaxID=2530388 RepID=UPI00104B10D4|nr:1,2-phenylacetyl-CoA epoxidase subunit PaaD [Streptomyces sp. 8K308]TDC20906.1 phenylacetate-CoA oxygenase subunit PaaJ [Streptomyces sp. 8K308]